MKREDGRARVQALLGDAPAGQLTVVRGPGEEEDAGLGQIQGETEGRGRVELYQLYPGMTAAYTLFLADEVRVRHPVSASVLELYHCRSGRVGWNMRDGMAVYLGSGDLSLHSAACCGDSDMRFPLGYSEGISLSVDLALLEDCCPEILAEAQFDPAKLRGEFCSCQPEILSACPELDGLFGPVYGAGPSLRRAYLKLKAQELLLYLQNKPQSGKEPPRHFSQQTELIQEIHRLLTEHLDQRFTIEELSRRYLINTSTLKEVFKAVYGLPVATYMKEYRIRRAMELLRTTDESIASIAQKVGYGSQGKFTQAFKEVAQVLPKEYRKEIRR